MTTCVLVADGGRARLFEIDRDVDEDYEAGPRLVELADSVNPESALLPREVFENVKSGRGRAPGGGGAHGYDDHREESRRELYRRFAKQVAKDTADLLERQSALRLVVVAEPRFLGLLREPLSRALGQRRVELTELAEDLTGQKHERIRQVLERHEILPKARTPRVVARGPGQPLRE